MIFEAFEGNVTIEEILSEDKLAQKRYLHVPTENLKRIYRDGKRLRVETKPKEYLYRDENGDIRKGKKSLLITVYEASTEQEARRMLKATQRALEFFRCENLKGAKSPNEKDV